MSGALKVKSCFGLDSWIVRAWSLKNKDAFRIGLVDCPRVEPQKQGVVLDWTCGLVDLWHKSNPEQIFVFKARLGGG